MPTQQSTHGGVIFSILIGAYWVQRWLPSPECAAKAAHRHSPRAIMPDGWERSDVALIKLEGSISAMLDFFSSPEVSAYSAAELRELDWELETYEMNREILRARLSQAELGCYEELPQ